MRGLHVRVLLVALVMALFLVPPLFTLSSGFCATASAEELWKQELLELCSKTDEAMSFSKDELKILLQRAEKLKPDIASLGETPRKVYQKRLQKCINLFSFVLDSKGADKK